jgi:hypothetical protein
MVTSGSSWSITISVGSQGYVDVEVCVDVLVVVRVDEVDSVVVVAVRVVSVDVVLLIVVAEVVVELVGVVVGVVVTVVVWVDVSVVVADVLGRVVVLDMVLDDMVLVLVDTVVEVSVDDVCVTVVVTPLRYTSYSVGAPDSEKNRQLLRSSFPQPPSLSQSWPKGTSASHAGKNRKTIDAGHSFVEIGTRSGGHGRVGT